MCKEYIGMIISARLRRLRPWLVPVGAQTHVEHRAASRVMNVCLLPFDKFVELLSMFPLKSHVRCWVWTQVHGASQSSFKMFVPENTENVDVVLPYSNSKMFCTRKRGCGMSHSNSNMFCTRKRGWGISHSNSNMFVPENVDAVYPTLIPRWYLKTWVRYIPL